MKGRKPVPAHLLTPEGHHKSEEEIKARREVEDSLKTKATLRCPSYLSSDAKSEWRRLMALYKTLKVNILCDLDVQLIVMYCEAVAIYKKAQETWVTYQRLVTSNEKYQDTIDRCLSIMNKQSTIVRGISEQLCLTPVGRARMGMGAVKKEKENPLEALFGDDD